MSNVMSVQHLKQFFNFLYYLYKKLMPSVNPIYSNKI